MLVNAGKELFQGAEFELSYHPKFLQYFAVVVGYAHHDAVYKVFSFVDPDEGLLDASGQRLELTPRDLWNVGLSYGPPAGFGGWFAIRHQNHRPFDIINIAYMPSFYEYDVGLSYTFGPARISIIGRNLGDSRHYVGRERDRRRSGLRRVPAAGLGRDLLPVLDAFPRPGPVGRAGPVSFGRRRQLHGRVPRPNKKAARADGGPHEPHEIPV